MKKIQIINIQEISQSIIFSKRYIKCHQAKNDQRSNQVNDALIVLKNAVNKKTIPGNENPDKLIDFVEKTQTLINNRKVIYQILNKCFKDYQQLLHK